MTHTSDHDWQPGQSRGQRAHPPQSLDAIWRTYASLMFAVRFVWSGLGVGGGSGCGGSGHTSTIRMGVLWMLVGGWWVGSVNHPTPKAITASKWLKVCPTYVTTGCVCTVLWYEDSLVWASCLLGRSKEQLKRWLSSSQGGRFNLLAERGGPAGWPELSSPSEKNRDGYFREQTWGVICPFQIYSRRWSQDCKANKLVHVCPLLQPWTPELEFLKSPRWVSSSTWAPIRLPRLECQWDLVWGPLWTASAHKPAGFDVGTGC